MALRFRMYFNSYSIEMCVADMCNNNKWHLSVIHIEQSRSKTPLKRAFTCHLLSILNLQIRVHLIFDCDSIKIESMNLARVVRASHDFVLLRLDVDVFILRDNRVLLTEIWCIFSKELQNPSDTSQSIRFPWNMRSLTPDEVWLLWRRLQQHF